MNLNGGNHQEANFSWAVKKKNTEKVIVGAVEVSEALTIEKGKR